jgi:hypothetical protein
MFIRLTLHSYQLYSLTCQLILSLSNHAQYQLLRQTLFYVNSLIKGNYFCIYIYMYIYILLAMHFHNLCNENKLDALLIPSLFRQSTSTCFGHVYCPSSGGIHCLCTAIGTCYMLG